jgi:5'-nucleotidase
MSDKKPDLVLSGVNRGNNAGENVMYSGTIGATIEASLQGVPAIAMSQFFGPANADLDQPFEAAAQHGADVVRRLLKNGLWGDEDYRLFYNVNFPPVAAADVQGMKVGAQGFRRGTAFTVEPHQSPSGRKFLWVKGGDQRVRTLPDTDVALNLDGYISVTPMRADLTDHATLAQLRDALE